MVCYHPIDAVLPAVPDKDGKKHLFFSKGKNSSLYFDDSPIVRDMADYANIHGFKIKVPCGRCIGCRLDYSIATLKNIINLVTKIVDVILKCVDVILGAFEVDGK